MCLYIYFYRFENWNFFLAFFWPNFFLSTILGSLVKRPFGFKILLNSLSISQRAFEIANLNASTWPLEPPPIIEALISYFPFVWVKINGWFNLNCEVGEGKYSLDDFLFIEIFPFPCDKKIRAIDFFRRPILWITSSI